MKKYLFLLTPLFTSLNLLGSNLVDKSTTPTLISSGYKFTEGAALAPNGDIFFNDIPNHKTYRYVVSDQVVKLHRSNTGASNGLMFDLKGQLIHCEGGNRQLTREVDGKAVPIATHFKGKKLNSPNDLAIDSTGGIFFTDPRYGRSDDLEQDSQGVYYVSINGEVKRLISDLKKPNGIALHKNQNLLYVADNGTGKIHAYDVKLPELTLHNERIITDQAPVNDGFKLDEHGNLWVTTKEGIKIFDSQGLLLETVVLPEPPANLVFGSKGSKTLYVTARTGIYKLTVKVDGQ